MKVFWEEEMSSFSDRCSIFILTTRVRPQVWEGGLCIGYCILCNQKKIVVWAGFDADLRLLVIARFTGAVIGSGT